THSLHQRVRSRRPASGNRVHRRRSPIMRLFGFFRPRRSRGPTPKELTHFSKPAVEELEQRMLLAIGVAVGTAKITNTITHSTLIPLLVTATGDDTTYAWVAGTGAGGVANSAAVPAL